IYAGRWCRTQETALELGLGAVETLDALGYFDGDLAAAQRCPGVILGFGQGRQAAQGQQGTHPGT
ncbi:hypothetical protein R0G64_32800, partial [Pseudomonas otitidis]|nr:hypothetical protein [Pseudomonas otitidis]